MNKKSSTCISKKAGKPLTEYDTEPEAQEGADYANSKHGNNLVPYHCDKCDRWHLSPKDRMTPSELCNTCTDGQGKNKMLYRTKTEAKKRASILLKEQGVKLDVYECPTRNGWHLTKNAY